MARPDVLRSKHLTAACLAGLITALAVLSAVAAGNAAAGPDRQVAEPDATTVTCARNQARVYVPGALCEPGRALAAGQTHPQGVVHDK